MKSATAATEPLSSMSLPNTAPSRNSGKNCARKVAALPMKVCVQLASSGSPPNSAATSAAAGASRSTLQPRNANATRMRRPIRMPSRPMFQLCFNLRSALRQQHVEIGGGALAEIVAMRFEKFVRGAAAFLVQERDELPLRVELGGGAELRQHVGDDAVGAHLRPARAFAAARIGHLPQQRDHTQFLHQ